MAGDRLLLHNAFIDMLGTRDEEETRVYFQPPNAALMKYPCIIYKRDDRKDFFSNNRIYLGMKRYLVTVVDEDPDSLIPDKVMGLRYCSFSLHFAIDNLNHDVFTLYF